MFKSFDEILELPSSQLAICLEKIESDVVASATSELMEVDIEYLFKHLDMTKKKEIRDLTAKNIRLYSSDSINLTQLYIVDAVNELISIGQIDMSEFKGDKEKIPVKKSNVLTQEEIDILMGFSVPSSFPNRDIPVESPSIDEGLTIDQGELSSLFG